MSTAVAMRAQFGPRFKSVLGSCIRPLCADRFLYHNIISVPPAGYAFLFQVTVPTGMIAVINRIGALVDFVNVVYCLLIDSVYDPGFPDQSWRLTPDGWSPLNMYPQASDGTYVFIKGNLLTGPVLVRENATFGLFADDWRGSAVVFGGEVSGYFMPRDLWREGA
jgi:hypothetical protein